MLDAIEERLIKVLKPFRQRLTIAVLVIAIGMIGVFYKLHTMDSQLNDLKGYTDSIDRTVKLNRYLSMYEYKIVSPPDTSFTMIMNDYGSKGWQIVYARRATSGRGIYTKYNYEIILMKRR